jgi:methylthioribose-1-phosphate isomerase
MFVRGKGRMKKSIDQLLPTILQKEKIVKIENNYLLIGDRREIPFKNDYVKCSSIDEIAKALKEMATQGGGPLQVGLTTLNFVAQQIEKGKMADSINTFIKAVHTLVQARPTNTTMARSLYKVIDRLSMHYQCSLIATVNDVDLVTFVNQIVTELEHSFDDDYLKMGEYGSSLIEDGFSILTTCFAEHSFLLSLVKAQKEGKKVEIYLNETRPYFQGSRLTAFALEELGIDFHIIGDSAGSNLMNLGKIDCYMTAADLVTMDGYVVNKVGTLANAISCSYYSIPYYAFAMSPDTTKETKDEIEVEIRDGKEFLSWKNEPITKQTYSAYYPSFDIIEPSLVDLIITPKGPLKPKQISDHYLKES